MQTIEFEDAVAEKFRLERAPTLFAQQEALTPIAFSRVHSEGGFRGRTASAPPEEAFSFLVALAPMQAGEIWIDGKYSKLEAASPGDTFVINLAADPVASLSPQYDFLRFYLPVATLDQISYDRGLRQTGGLRTTSLGIPDPVMQGLALSVVPMLQTPDAATAMFLDSVGLAFHAHVVRRYAGSVESKTPARMALAPWQLRRVHAFVAAHLDGDPSIADLARECRLSASHFARAFRQTTGLPPHRWLMKQRIERAKELLLEGRLHLVEIALACGFVDQSHLTRIFGRFEGQSPGKWRRLRLN